MIAGRTPKTEEIGLDSIGVEAGGMGIPVDDHCRIARMDGLWAIGDVTGMALFTHAAQYQGRIVAANILAGTAGRITRASREWSSRTRRSPRRA